MNNSMRGWKDEDEEDENGGERTAFENLAQVLEVFFFFS